MIQQYRQCRETGKTRKEEPISTEIVSICLYLDGKNGPDKEKKKTSGWPWPADDALGWLLAGHCTIIGRLARFQSAQSSKIERLRLTTRAMAH